MTTVWSVSFIRWRTTAEPIKPAPPVTKIVLLILFTKSIILFRPFRLSIHQAYRTTAFASERACTK
ncbi:hypothetical protein RJ43_08860 [Alteromonas macleodii]|nr:hypothetical protein RJ43_08860 [Alteromonas macleodii]